MTYILKQDLPFLEAGSMFEQKIKNGEFECADKVGGVYHYKEELMKKNIDWFKKDFIE